MSWLFSQALAEAYSPANNSDGGQSAQSNASHPPPQSYSTARTPDILSPSRFGMTCAPLTATDGEDLLTSYLAGFRARTSPSPAPAPDSPERGPVSGESSRASFAKWNPATSTWRTPQLSLFGGSELYSETWPRWGSMRGGECTELTRPRSRVVAETLRSLTTGIESGYARISERVPTPTVSDSVKGDCPSERRRNSPSLVSAIVVRERVPTPSASEADGGPQSPDKRRGGGHQVRLRDTVTPRLLNPDWVEWLMGWPVGWTDIDNDHPAEHGFWSEPEGVPRTTSKRDRRGKRLKAIGNGQVPQCAVMAWMALSVSKLAPHNSRTKRQ